MSTTFDAEVARAIEVAPMNAPTSSIGNEGALAVTSRHAITMTPVARRPKAGPSRSMSRPPYGPSNAPDTKYKAAITPSWLSPKENSACSSGAVAPIIAMGSEPDI